MPQRYNEEMTIDEIMRRWPQTIPMILRYRLLCFGCPVAPFHTVLDAIREHDIDGLEFRRELHATIGECA